MHQAPTRSIPSTNRPPSPIPFPFIIRCRLDAAGECCAFMRTGAAPSQTITVLMLGLLAVLLPVLYV